MNGESTTYCGLYCPNCLQKAQVGPEAQRLHESLKRLGYEEIGPMIPGFMEFWTFLSDLAADDGCRGCRQEGGNPYCEIRICAKQRNAEFCAFCADYPCGRFPDAFAAYKMLEKDNRYLQENGREQWIEMQKERRRQGYTYTDANEDGRRDLSSE